MSKTEKLQQEIDTLTIQCEMHYDSLHEIDDPEDAFRWIKFNRGRIERSVARVLRIDPNFDCDEFLVRHGITPFTAI